MQRDKFDYIDVTRGICMLLVVYGHILFFGYLGTDIYKDAGYVVGVTSCLRMPMFFFISGFCRIQFLWIRPFLTGEYETGYSDSYGQHLS